MSDKLKELAAKVTEAHFFNERERAATMQEISKTCKLHGLGINEVLQYVQNNNMIATAEAERAAKQKSPYKAETLTGFTDEWKAKTNGEVSSPAFLADLNAHIKTIRNFNYYA